MAGLYVYDISPNRITSISVIHYFHHDGCSHHNVCIERPISRQQIWDDVFNEMIMMNKMMSFLSGRVVHDEVDSDYSIVRERAPVVQGGWADGQRKAVVISQIPVAAASTYNDNALYTSKWTTTEQSSEALGLVHPQMLSNRCVPYTAV